MRCDDPSPHGPHPAPTGWNDGVYLCEGSPWDQGELQAMAALAQAGFTFAHLDPHQQPHDERR